MKLNLGCGAKYMKDYLNIDAPVTSESDPHIKADAYSKIEDLKFADDSIECIRMEAVFEHFPRHKALFLLRRMYKWLRVGGHITIVVPDLMKTVDMIKSTTDTSLKMFLFRHLFGPQDSLKYGIHYDGFDDEKLKYTFKAVGFYEFKSVHKGRWPSIYFTAWKSLPTMSDHFAEKNIMMILRQYARGSKSNYLINNWLEQSKDVL